MSTAVSSSLALLSGVLLGSIPFGVLVARAWTGADVRRVGSGNIGATNVIRASGPWPGLLTLALDAGKGALAVFAARLLMAAAGPLGEGAGGAFAPGRVPAWAGFAAVAGHIFCPWLLFRGGKGVATAAGVLAALSPPLAAAALAVFALALLAARIVSLASLIACLGVPLLAASSLFRDPPPLAVLIPIGALILMRHRPNVARLLRGEEPGLNLGARRSNLP